jgi:tetratricopeptide (TPR) repeat protein
MAKRKRISRKRMKEDQLVTLTLKTSQFIQAHFPHIVTGIVVIVAAIAIALFVAHSRRSAAHSAQQALASAMAYYEIRDFDTARQAFTEITQQYSSHREGVIALYYLGEINMAAQRYTEALDAFERFLKHGGKYPLFEVGAEIGKGYCLEDLGRYLEAAETLEEVSTKMDPKDPRTLDVMMQVAMSYQKGGKPDRAMEFYKKVSEKAVGDLKVRANVAMALLEKGS